MSACEKQKRSVCLCVCMRVWRAARGHPIPFARRTPRLLAGGLSALRGQADLIFHRNAARPWTPSLSPHGRPESCFVNTWLKYAAFQAPSTMRLTQSLGLTITSQPQLQMLAAVFNPLGSAAVWPVAQRFAGASLSKDRG